MADDKKDKKDKKDDKGKEKDPNKPSFFTKPIGQAVILLIIAILYYAFLTMLYLNDAKLGFNTVF